MTEICGRIVNYLVGRNTARSRSIISIAVLNQQPISYVRNFRAETAERIETVWCPRSMVMFCKWEELSVRRAIQLDEYRKDSKNSKSKNRNIYSIKREHTGRIYYPTLFATTSCVLSTRLARVVSFAQSQPCTVCTSEKPCYGMDYNKVYVCVQPCIKKLGMERSFTWAFMNLT